MSSDILRCTEGELISRADCLCWLQKNPWGDRDISALDHYVWMNSTLVNETCIWFLLFWRREERKFPEWVLAGTYLGLKAGREGSSGTFPLRESFGSGLVAWHKKVQSFRSESISNQVRFVFFFSGISYLEILDLCKTPHSSLSLCWFHCGFSCWETLLTIFLFPNLWANSGQNICVKSRLAAELPAFSSQLLWKLHPFHLCHMPQPSRLLLRFLLGSVPDLSLAGVGSFSCDTWSQFLPPDSSPVRPRMERAQLRAGGEFPLAWRRLLGILFTSSIPLAHFNPWMILDSYSEWNYRSGQSYEKPVESKTVLSCGTLPRCVRHRFYKATLSGKSIYKMKVGVTTRSGTRLEVHSN